MALYNLNQKMLEEDKPLYSQSAIRELVLRLQPKSTTIVKRKQGSHNPDSAWAKQRYAQACQLLLQVGHDQSLADPFKESLVDDDGVVQFDADGQPIQVYPAWCDKSKLLPDYAVDLQYVSWCNKMHRQCDPNGSYADADEQLNVKYSRESGLV
jgi:hypothetical protein